LLRPQRSLRRQGDYARAIADYDEAIRLDPKNFGAYYRRGAYANKGELDRAIADSDR
jgi:tetratricopeptide (TPR) repeat protein